MFEIFISGTLSAVALYFELYYEEPLDDSSALLIEWLQLSYSEFFRVLFQIIGLVTAVVLLVVGCVVYLAYNREIGFLGANAGFLGAAFAGMLKPLIGHPRPFWKYKAVKGLACPMDYGAPSGHALSVGAALMVLGRFWLQVEGNYKAKLSLLVLSGLVVALDRLYLGVHFYSQIILGFSMAQLITSIFMNEKSHEFLFAMRRQRKVALFVAGGLLILSGVSLVAYLLVNPSWDALWEVNFQENCHAIFTAIDAVLKNISEGTLFSLCAGFSFGYHLCRSDSTRCFSRRKLGASCALVASVLVYMLAMDTLFITILPNLQGLLLMNVNKFVVGLMLGYGIPYILVKYVDKESISELEFATLYRMQ